MIRRHRRVLWLSLALLGLGANIAEAQGYRLRLDSRVQRVTYRGLSMDSIPVEDVVTADLVYRRARKQERA